MSEARPSWTRPTKGNGFSGIGSLEADVLAIVWEAAPQPVKVRLVYERLRTERQIAYTTVMTVMGNLVKKGLLSQERRRFGFLYRSAIPGDVLDDVVGRLYRGRRITASRGSVTAPTSGCCARSSGRRRPTTRATRR